MSEVPGSTASQRIAEIIGERILNGALAPGARIKQEEIAEELAASRIPVREALRILESRGLVTLKSNSGAWVSQMDPHDLGISYQIRERIEPLLLVESMPRLTSTDLAELHEIQDDIESSDDVERFLVLDRRFHWATYRRHQTPQLAGMVERLWDTTQHYRRAFTHLAGRHGSWIICSEHRLLMEAIASADPETASTILTMHIRRTRLQLALHPEVFSGTSPPAP